MKNITVCILILLIIITTVVLFKKIDNDEKNTGPGKKFKLNFDDHNLKCNCDLDKQVEHFDTYGTVNFSESDIPQLDNTLNSKPFDKEVINLDSDKPYETDDYTNHMLCKKYYDHADKSAEDYYEYNYRYPIDPLTPKGKIKPLNNNEYTYLKNDTDNILDLKTVNDSYIFAY